MPNKSRLQKWDKPIINFYEKCSLLWLYGYAICSRTVLLNNPVEACFISLPNWFYDFLEKPKKKKKPTVVYLVLVTTVILHYFLIFRKAIEME